MGASLADGPSVALGAGHREWLAALYEAHFPAVFRLCSRVLRNPDDAADASQEVFLVAANSLERNATAARARAWLLTVARNHCLNLLRRRQRLGRALVTLGGGSGGDPDPQTAVVDRDFVDGVLRKLSVRERQALWQSAVEHRPLADIAGRLRLSYMAAAQVVHRARRHAVQVAGRVAIVVGLFRLGRAARRLPAITIKLLSGTEPTGEGSVLVAHRLLLAAAVPLIVVASQASSSNSTGKTAPPRAAAAVTQLVQAPAAVLSRSGAGAARSGATGANPASSAATSIANSVVSRAAQTTPQLPGVNVPGMPSVPGLIPTPPPLPKLP